MQKNIWLYHLLIVLNYRNKLCQFNHNDQKYRLVHIVTLSFDTILRQMTKMSQLK